MPRCCPAGSIQAGQSQRPAGIGPTITLPAARLSQKASGVSIPPRQAAGHPDHRDVQVAERLDAKRWSWNVWTGDTRGAGADAASPAAAAGGSGASARHR